MPSIRERPILFSGPLVRAILAGAKTVTRRVVRPRFRYCPGSLELSVDGWPEVISDTGCFARVPCPFGEPDDRLWVRETFARLDDYRGADPGTHALSFGHFYAADYLGVRVANDDGTEVRWRPSIHMPRKASRILLDVVDVSCEHLSAMTDGEALAEGVEFWEGEGYPLEKFRAGWDGLNAKRGAAWADDPLVWRVEFRRVPS